MRVVIDIECNSLHNPTQIWLIVCKDIDTGQLHIFRSLTSDDTECQRFISFSRQVVYWIGHNWLGYDWPNLSSLLKLHIVDLVSRSCDTLICSKLINYGRDSGHSIEAYGLEFGTEKIGFNDWTKWSQEMEDYCVRDVDICHRIYLKYRSIIDDPSWSEALYYEHAFQLVDNALHRNGFSFSVVRARALLEFVTAELAKLDVEILRAFPPKLKLIKEIYPKETKYGTISKTDFRFVRDGDLSIYNGGPFCRCEWASFNPSSHKQLVDVLHDAGWSPIDRTQTHVDTEREINSLKYQKHRDAEVDLRLQECYDKILGLRKYGWKINENNLSTLPSTAPSPARTLAQRILYESRRRTLTEWLSLFNPDTGRIHGTFQGIGAWTHRMAHQRPNTANIPNELDLNLKKKLLGKEMRALWQAPRNRLLVGVDAEGIQLRIFAHYIDDKEFTNALVNGKKSDKSDPHSLNQRVLGSVCKSRAAAKRFIYALLLGAGIGKLAHILECSESDTKAALDRLITRYGGFQTLKDEVIPKDARRGYFFGLDGRKVPLPGGSFGERKHLAMSGYLQNGEAIVMKRATLKWHHLLEKDDAILVNLVHDEWQTECPNNMEIALRIAHMQSESLRLVGEELKLKCPLAGSYWNEDLKDYTIGTNWSVTH